MSTLNRKGAAGRMLQVTAPTGGLSNGDIHILRSGTSGWCGEVREGADATETAVIEYGHQLEVPKNTGTGEEFSQGDLVYRDASTEDATPDSTGNTLMGAATADASTTDTVVWVQMNLS